MLVFPPGTSPCLSLASFPRLSPSHHLFCPQDHFIYADSLFFSPPSYSNRNPSVHALHTHTLSHAKTASSSLSSLFPFFICSLSLIAKTSVLKRKAERKGSHKPKWLHKQQQQQHCELYSATERRSERKEALLQPPSPLCSLSLSLSLSLPSCVFPCW